MIIHLCYNFANMTASSPAQSTIITKNPAKKRRKILFLITKSNWGGAQKYVYDLATGLDKNEFETKVALGGNGILTQKLREAGVPVIEIPTLGRDINLASDFKVLIDIIQIIRNEKPDILHVNSSKISGLGSFAGKLFGVKKIIFTAHGWAFNENRSALSKLIIKTAYLLTLWFSDETIGVSKALADQVASWPFNKKKLHIIHNGIASPDFINRTEAKSLLLEKVKLRISPELAAQVDLFLAPGTVWFGTIGELHHIKGQIFAIRAFAEIAKHRPNLNFIFIIMSEGEIRQTLEDEIARLGLGDRVFLPGHVLDGATYLKAFDYYIFPSLSEGLAYAILEAGRAELPVIASRVGGIPEIIENGENGTLVESKNPQAIENAIYQYLDNPEIAQKHAVALLQKTSNEFSVKKMIEETRKVYSRE